MSKTINEFLYSKEVTCPVCGNTFEVIVVKKSALRVVNTESDGHQLYKNVSPLLYDVWNCDHCGFTATSGLFTRISNKMIEAVRTKISPLWNPRKAPMLHTHNQAIFLYKLALSNGVALGLSNNDLSFLCLKTAWLYREMGNRECELMFLQKALQGFTNVYMKESGKILALTREQSVYILGDLSARVGDKDRALTWLTHVIVSKMTPKDLKEKALALKERIKESMRVTAMR